MAVDNSGKNFDQFVGLLARHQRRLYQYIVAILPNSSDADDVLQETLLVLWRKFDEFQPGTNFHAWASRIAYLEVLKLRQKKLREMVLDDDVLEQVAAEAAKKSGVLEARREALRVCLTKLRQSDRELIAQRYEQGVKIKDLAARLGRTPNSVSQSLVRIRRWLWECVNRSTRGALVGG